MTHALRNYSGVSTRLWNNFFWNNFQGIIFEGGRCTIMHVGIWKSWSSPSRYPGIIRFWNNFGNLKHLKTSWSSLYFLHLAWPFQKPFLAWRCLPDFFCWKCQLQLFKASCSLGNCCQPFFAAYLHAQLVSTGPPFSHGTFSRELFGWQWMRNVRKIPRKRPGWVPLCGLSPRGKLF